MVRTQQDLRAANARIHDLHRQGEEVSKSLAQANDQIVMLKAELAHAEFDLESQEAHDGRPCTSRSSAAITDLRRENHKVGCFLYFIPKKINKEKHNSCLMHI